jgi:hypothetical protein
MSHYSTLLKQKAEAKAKATISASANPLPPIYLGDLSETDPYYFIVKEGGKIIAEGNLIRIKLQLDEVYLKRQILSIVRNRETMTAVLNY